MTSNEIWLAGGACILGALFFSMGAYLPKYFKEMKSSEKPFWTRVGFYALGAPLFTFIATPIFGGNIGFLAGMYLPLVACVFAGAYFGKKQEN